MNINNTDGEFKTSPASDLGGSQADHAKAVDIVRAIGRLPINPTAKLVAVTMRTTRVTDTKTLAEILGLSMRVVQRSKNEIADMGDTYVADTSDTGDISDTYVATSTNPATPMSLLPAPRVHARAQMESPSEIHSSQEVASKSREEEIPGLNGSTYRYVDMLAGWLAGDLRPKEPEVAHAILAGNVEHYGPDKVKGGMLELQAAIGAGQKPRDPGKAFSAFVKNAKPPNAGEPPKPSKVEERKANGLKLLESIRARAAAEAAA